MIERLNAALEGRYRIERELGEGGMATVYLAEDLKHHREVALKVLKPELAAVVGGERFLAEIETTANLRHPHILPLFDSGAEDGILFYVMPYVEGESLRDRIDREKQLPVDEAVRIGIEVAEALEHAHRQGVVHRDVKPANILLQDGRPMVSDFGIALAVSAAGEGRLTETGLSLGTPYYMSPEQATGDRDVDARSDVYALACVLYEMLAGEPPYTGTTAQAVLGRILMGEPTPLAEQRRMVPPHVDAVVMRSLQKLPADRLSSAADFARALREPEFGRAAGIHAAGGAATRGGRLRWAVPGALLLGGLLGVVGGAVLGPAGGVGLPERQRIVLGSGIESLPRAVGVGTALAPDGSGILFADTVGAAEGGGSTYWWKPAGESDAVRLPGLDGAVAVTFSPDGEWVAFVTDGELRKQPLRGGTAIVLADSLAGGNVHALAWLEDGTIVFENTDFVMQRLSEDGSGEPESLTTEESAGQPIHAAGLPGGGAFLLSSADPGSPSTDLYLVDAEADTVVRLADGVYRAWPVPGGKILMVDRRGGILVADLDRDARSIGPAVPLFDGVRTLGNAAEIQLGADGTLLYVRGPATSGGAEVVTVDRAGGVEPVDPAWRAGQVTTPAVSPDGRRLALSITAAGGRQVWVKELPAGPLTRLTVDAGRSYRPVWMPDGRSIAYVTDEGGRAHVRALRADGSSPSPDTLLLREAGVWEVLFPPGGGTLFREGSTSSREADIRYLPPSADGADGAAVDVVATEFNERAVHLSPDGGWLAYVSDASGRDEVFVRPFPESGTRQVQVSRDGGREPVWSRSGEEIFYRDGGGWMVAARVSADPDFTVDSRERLFDARSFLATSIWRHYDVTPDGRFLMFLRTDQADEDRGDLVLVENFFRELEEVVGR